MNQKKASLWVAGVTVLGLIAAGGYWKFQQPAGGTQDSAVMATPVGITLQPLANAAGYGHLIYNHEAAIPRLLQFTMADRVLAYGNAKGMVFYTYDKDEPGKSNCAGDCAKTWPPAVADSNAKPVGNWSLVGRDDGTKQWAYRGKPLYTFVKDTKIGGVGGMDPTPKKSSPTDFTSYQEPKLAPGWHVALYQPGAGMNLPEGMAIRDVADANGRALVDPLAKTLYTFDGAVNNDKPVCAVQPCINHWKPFAASELANPAGDFSVVSRDDGFTQWVYKGKPLYTFEGDLAPGDANGDGVDPQFHVALVERYFRPTEVRLQETPSHGKILATVDGMVLYRHDVPAFWAGGQSFRNDIVYQPAVGREVGERGCNTAECLKDWHPLKAPPDAQPSGFWSVTTQADGTKLWTYNGYPLYTYAGDKKPGDTMGEHIYDFRIVDDNHQINQGDTPLAGATYWLLAVP